MSHAHVDIARAFTAALLFVGFGLSAWADVPRASREADRQAKFAVPAAGEALVYVYRPNHAGAPAVAVAVNGRDSVQLAPRTFMLWKVEPGRAELTAEGAATRLVLPAEGGRVYYVELSGRPVALRQVSFAAGRAQIQQAHLVARPAAVPPAPVATQPPRYRGNVALALKAGSFKLAEESQRILSANRRFDASASSVFALEGEWFVQPTTSFGLEVLSYANDYTTPGSTASGSTDTTAVLFNVKRYFGARAWQPYLGLGIGGAAMDFSGVITGNTGGLALQLAGGLQWRSSRMAVRAEYKYLNADTEDDNGQKVDASGSGLFLGIGVYF